MQAALVLLNTPLHQRGVVVCLWVCVVSGYVQAPLSTYPQYTTLSTGNACVKWCTTTGQPVQSAISVTVTGQCSNNNLQPVNVKACTYCWHYCQHFFTDTSKYSYCYWPILYEQRKTLIIYCQNFDTVGCATWRASGLKNPPAIHKGSFLETYGGPGLVYKKFPESRLTEQKLETKTKVVSWLVGVLHHFQHK